MIKQVFNHDQITGCDVTQVEINDIRKYGGRLGFCVNSG